MPRHRNLLVPTLMTAVVAAASSPISRGAARAKVEAFVKKTGAQLWIEHDIATHAKLPKSPKYVE